MILSLYTRCRSSPESRCSTKLQARPTYRNIATISILKHLQVNRGSALLWASTFANSLPPFCIKPTLENAVVNNRWGMLDLVFEALWHVAVKKLKPENARRVPERVDRVKAGHGRRWEMLDGRCSPARRHLTQPGLSEIIDYPDQAQWVGRILTDGDNASIVIDILNTVAWLQIVGHIGIVAVRVSPGMGDLSSPPNRTSPE